MKIAIINKTTGGISGGHEKYLYNVIPRLAMKPQVESVLCATPKSVNNPELFNELKNLNFINCQPFQFLHHKVEQELELQLERFSPDVILIPLGRYSKFKKVPTIIMVRNEIPLVYFPFEYSFKDKLKVLAQRIEIKIAIKRADKTIAVSNFVKDFLIKKWRILEEQITVIYHGHDLFNLKGQKPNLISENWKGKFLFTAGSIQPYRGLEDILLAMKYLEFQDIKIKGLVIAGEVYPKMFSYQNRLKNWIQNQTLSSKVCWAGKLNEKEMAWCFKNCAAFVMSSRVEACPNIALEAMSYGCISISSNTPPLPEIFSDVAIYYPPKNSKRLTEIILSINEWDNNQRREVSKRARKQAAKFSWEITVDKLLIEI